MDTFIISKISDYLSASKNFELAKEIKNKTISKVLLEKCYKNSSYVVYINENKIHTISLPVKREKTDYPELNYKEMTNKGIKNFMFFYQLKSKKIHAFQHLPSKYQEITVDEDIEETNFYEIDEYSFLLNVNHTSLYKFERFKRTKKTPLAQGFFFEETIYDNKIYSQFFGEELIVQDLETLDEYRLKLKSNTYYDFVAKDLLLLDFAFSEEVLDNALPSNNLSKEDKKNCLFKFHLVKGSPNQITLEFVAFLPRVLRIQRFDFRNGYYWARVREEKYVSLWRRDKELHKIYIDDMDKCIDVDKIDNERFLIEYHQEVALLDYATGKITPKIDMTKKIEKLKSLGTLKKVGDYYTLILLVEVEALGGWRQYVLDMNFNILYEIERDQIFRSYCYPY